MTQSCVHHCFSAFAALIVGGFLFVTLLFFAPETSLAKNNYEQNLTEYSAQSRADAAMAMMEENGLIAAIQSRGGAYVKQLAAIAIRESDGILAATNKSSQATCAFQVMPLHFKDYAAKNNMTVEQFVWALKNDPKVCADTGASILEGHISRQGSIGGFCGYAGDEEYEIFKRTGTCPMYEHVDILMAAIDKTLTVEVIANAQSEDHSKIKVTTPSGTQMVLTCHDRGQALAQAMAKAYDSYINNEFHSADEVMMMTKGDETSKPIHNSAGNVMDTYCIGNIMDFFDYTRFLVDSIKWFNAIVTGFAQRLVDEVCTYFTTFNETIIQLLLGAICVPIPDLSIGIDLDGPQRKSCGDGLSLGDLLGVGVGQGSLDDLKNKLYDGTSFKGSPPINGHATTRPDYPDLYMNLRRYQQEEGGTQ